VSGASTVLSSLNIVGNFVGSGTALTNLNYNAITNNPDITVYATNVSGTNANFNSLSSYTYLNISGTNRTLNNKTNIF
jgi:hypothetical protein